MLGSLLVAPDSNPSRFTQQGQVVVQGIAVGANNGQLSVGDQEAILSSAANTPGGSALFMKNMIAAAAGALVVGAGLGYIVARRKRR